MKKYNVQNYVRWKHDMASCLKRLPHAPYEELSRDDLIIKFLPLVENLARKFSTAQTACGILTINDLIQEGNRGLCAGVDSADIYEAMLQTNYKGNKITISGLAKTLNVTPRTIYRRMNKYPDLKQEKEILNEEA